MNRFLLPLLAPAQSPSRPFLLARRPLLAASALWLGGCAVTAPQAPDASTSPLTPADAAHLGREKPAPAERAERASPPSADAAQASAPSPTSLEPVKASPDEVSAGTAREIGQGLASWYGKRFHGRRTASGEAFNMHALTAAHRTLPFGTRVRVRSLETGREVVVRINDRGPAVRTRVLDISLGAARALGVHHHGVSRVVLLRE